MQFKSCSSHNRSQAPAVLAAPVSPTPFLLAPGDLAGDRKGPCGTGLFQSQRLFSFQLASALRELLLCGCDEVVWRCPLCVNWEEFPTATNIFIPLWLRFCKWKWFYYFVKVNTSSIKLPYRTTHVIFQSYPVLRMDFVWQIMVRKWMDCIWFSVFCSVHLGHDKKLWLIRTLYTESPYWFILSLTILQQQVEENNAVMQLSRPQQKRGMMNHPLKKLFSFYHWTPKDTARALLYIGTSDLTPSVKFTASLQLLRPGCNLGALEQVDKVTPWDLGLKGP